MMSCDSASPRYKIDVLNIGVNIKITSYMHNYSAHLSAVLNEITARILTMQNIFKNFTKLYMTSLF